jgi:hypothetical protein
MAYSKISQILILDPMKKLLLLLLLLVPTCAQQRFAPTDPSLFVNYSLVSPTEVKISWGRVANYRFAPANGYECDLDGRVYDAGSKQAITLPVEPGTDNTVRIRPYNATGVRSAWSPTVKFRSLANLTPTDAFDISNGVAGTAGTWNHYAQGLEKLPPRTDGFVQITPVGIALLGLSVKDEPGSYQTVDYGLFAFNGQYYFVEKGRASPTSIDAIPGDKERVKRENGVVGAYRVRGETETLVHSFGIYNGNLVVKFALVSAGDSFTDAVGFNTVNKWKYLDGSKWYGLGDSLLRGFGSTNNANGWMVQARDYLAGQNVHVSIINAGVDSATDEALNGYAFSTVDPYFDPNAKCFFFYQEVGNTIYFNPDPENAVAVAKKTIANRSAPYYAKIWLGLMDRGLDPSLTKTPGGQTREEYQASLKIAESLMESSFNEVSDGFVKDNTAPLDNCFRKDIFIDQTHPNDVGYWFLGKKVLNRMSTMEK